MPKHRAVRTRTSTNHPSPGSGLLVGIGLAVSLTVVGLAVPDCDGRPVGEGQASAFEAAQLLEAGWFGLQSDGEERLYPPACRP
jgi:hypothetical protein